MGLTGQWTDDLFIALQRNGIDCIPVLHPRFNLISAVDANITINCISIYNDFVPEDLLAIQHQYVENGMQLIHLWEDIFLSRNAQVLNRIQSLCGQNIRLHGRKTKVVKLSKPIADEFLVKHHIQGSVSARYKLGLLYADELVAVATFSGTRLMKDKKIGYRSAELIRFATKSGYTITGGLSKLIKYFVATVQTNDVMTYADRDWSNGKAYKSTGFTLEGTIPPAEFLVDIDTHTRYLNSRIAVESLISITPQDKLVKIFNTGSLKYILYL